MMTKKEIKKKIEQLEEEKWWLSISTDRFTFDESQRYGELCKEISKLKQELGDKE